MKALLDVLGLGVELPTDRGLRPVLSDISFRIHEGEALGLVGESGSGKSMTARAVLRLLPEGARTTGRVTVQGRDVLTAGASELRDIRSNVAMVFQDPKAHINPVRTIGDFMTEGLRLRGKLNRAEAERRAAAILGDVGVADAGRRLRQFPHELSGGLLQRVMIGTALLAEPSLLLADEPTTALDVSTQADVMAILNDLRADLGLSLLFITHDLDLAAAVCDRTAVMYAGTLLEIQESERLHEHPMHPYTAALSASRPSLTATSARLPVPPGRPLSAFEAGPGCPFAPRCNHRSEVCDTKRPPLELHGSGLVACHHPLVAAEQLEAANGA